MSENTQESNSLPETQITTQEIAPITESTTTEPAVQPITSPSEVQVEVHVPSEVKPEEPVNSESNHPEVKTEVQSPISEEGKAQPTNVTEDKKDTPPASVKNSISAEDIEKFKKEGIDILIEKYLDDGIIDNEELIDLVQTAMEIAEQKTVLSGPEKKSIVMAVLRSFLETKVNNYPQLEILIGKSIDLAVNVTRNGLGEIKISSETISQSKSAFNLIYENTMSKIEEKYPQTDDIINNIFDIALYIMQLLEGQTNLKPSEKKVLLKKILTKVINSLDSKINAEQKSFLISQIEPTISLVQIGIRASNGEIQINPEEVASLCSCFFSWLKCCKSKK